MTYEVLEQINAMADDIFAEGIEAERIGRVADDTAKKMKAIGSIRMLQPKEHGGMEAHPREFAETVMRMASLNPSAGWVHGIVGVHPWQLAFADPKVQQEIWGSDPDTWMASPYMPGGMCIPTDGGYKFSGRWQFSSGTDHCDWAFLGAMACDKDGNMEMPPRMLHVIIPRTDYEIIEDSWDVMGLRGTGSKDLVVKDAYVPRLPRHGLRRGHRRHGSAQVRAHRDAVPHAVVEHVPPRNHRRHDRHLRGNALPRQRVPSRSHQRAGYGGQGRPVHLVRHRSGNRRHPGWRATPCLPTSTACGIAWTQARK